MEIDPRLRAGSDSGSVNEGASENTATEYPDPTLQFSDRQHPPSSSTTRGLNTFYRGTQAQIEATQSLYHEELQQSSSSSTIRTSPQGDPSIDPNDPYSDLKRQRACEACRHLKVRCDPDQVNPNGPCKRCAKAGRSCVVTAPTRKRQKKTDSRVAELERKIDALTASLQASQGQEPIVQASDGVKESSGRRWLGPAQSSSSSRPGSSTPSVNPPIGNKRDHRGDIKDSRETGFLTQICASHTSPPTAPGQPADSVGKRWRSPWSATAPSSREESSNKPADVIERGLVSQTIALEAFTRFVDSMSHHIPMVVFPPGTQMDDIRKNKPVLFQAIVAVAIGPFQPDAQIPILTDLYKVISERVIVKGEKSLDLVQALLVSCAFYSPPDNFEEMKFYQLAQLAVSVAMDVGMYRRQSQGKGPKSFSFLREVTKKPPILDLDSPEMRRAWLGCYFLTIQVSTALRRPILVRWLSYMDECVEILEKSPDALPSDKAMIQWAKLVRIIEEISLQFFSDDSPSFLEPKFQFTLKAFEKQLEQWKKEIPPEYYSTSMKQAQAIVGIYLHENSLHIESSDSEDNKKSNEDISNPATAARVSALSAALTSIHESLDTICSIPKNELINLPTITLARTSFAIVTLIKLYSIVNTPESFIGQVINTSNLKVEYYLDKVISLYAAAGELPGGFTPGKFSTVLAMLRDWFLKRKDQNAVLKEAFRGPHSLACPGPGTGLDQDKSRDPNNNDNDDNNNKTGQTPLHLLSEVAINPNQHNQQTPYHSLQNRPGGFSSTEPSPSDLITPGSSTTATDSDTAWAQYSSAPSLNTQRQFYHSSFNPSSNDQGDLTGYANPDPSGSGLVMPSTAMATQGIFVPELGIQVGYDSDSLFALGNLLGDGLFNLPLSADLGFY